MIETGFSSAIRSTGAARRRRTNSKASSCSFNLSLNHRAPLTARCVQGGCAIIKSQPSPKTSHTSPRRCLPGRSEGSRSQLQASCPCAAKASRTIPENSQATSTRTASLFPSLHNFNRSISSVGLNQVNSAARIGLARVAFTRRNYVVIPGAESPAPQIIFTLIKFKLHGVAFLSSHQRSRA